MSANFTKINSTSDHNIVGARIELSTPSSSNEPMFIRKWRNYDAQKAIFAVSNKNWYNLEHLTVQQLADRIDANITEAVEEVTPTIKIKFVKRRYQWSCEINKMLINKKNLATKLRKTKTPC